MATITPTEVATGITGLRCVKWDAINANTSDVGAPAYIAGAEDLILYCTVTDASASAAWVWEMSPEPTPADANYFTLMTSTNADQSRIDLIDLQNWMRGTYKDLSFLKLGGSTVLPVPNSTSYDATEISYLAWSQQFACKNPRRGGYISGLTVPF